MFKGICIDSTMVYPIDCIIEGQVYILEPYDNLSYLLPEPDGVFLKKRFIPLSNKDETEYSEQIIDKMFVKA